MTRAVVRVGSSAAAAALALMTAGALTPGEAFASTPSPHISPSADWSCALATAQHQQGEDRYYNCHQNINGEDLVKSFKACAENGLSNGAMGGADSGVRGAIVWGMGGCIWGIIKH